MGKLIKSQKEYTKAMNRVSDILDEDILSPKTEKELEELVVKIKAYEQKLIEEMDDLYDAHNTEGC